MVYLIIIGIGVLIGICIYMACLIATDEQKRIDHEWELKGSAKREGQWYGNVFISDEEMAESARNVMRRMREEGNEF